MCELRSETVYAAQVLVDDGRDMKCILAQPGDELAVLERDVLNIPGMLRVRHSVHRYEMLVDEDEVRQ